MVRNHVPAARLPRCRFCGVSAADEPLQGAYDPRTVPRQRNRWTMKIWACDRHIGDWWKKLAEHTAEGLRG